MNLILSTEWTFFNANGERVPVPAGAHQVERVKSPLGDERDWLVLRGTRIGASEDSLRDWHRAGHLVIEG